MSAFGVVRSNLDKKFSSFLPSSCSSLELNKSDYRVSRLLSLVGSPAVVLVVLNFFHFRSTEVTELLGTSWESFYSLLQIFDWTQPLETLPGFLLSAVRLFADRVCLCKSQLTTWQEDSSQALQRPSCLDSLKFCCKYVIFPVNITICLHLSPLQAWSSHGICPFQRSAPEASGLPGRSTPTTLNLIWSSSSRKGRTPTMCPCLYPGTSPLLSSPTSPRWPAMKSLLVLTMQVEPAYLWRVMGLQQKVC